MKRSAAALGVAALGLASLSGVDAVYCAYATGSCTIQPCPDTTLGEWGTCILSDPADCPRGCALYPNAQRGEPGICGLPGGSKEEITNQELSAIQSCLANITPDCIISNLSLLDGLGCENCVADLTTLQSLNEDCESINNEERCMETWVPCPGEPEQPPEEMPEMAPMMGPMMAPGPATMMAPTPAMTPESGTPAPPGGGTTRETGSGGDGSDTGDNASQASGGGGNNNSAPSMKAAVAAVAAGAACAAALL